MNLTNDEPQKTHSPQKMSSGKCPWYTKNVWIILLLVFFFPIGLFLMWKYSKWGKKTKGIITAVILILAIVSSVDNKETEPSNDSIVSIDEQRGVEENSSAQETTISTEYTEEEPAAQTGTITEDATDTGETRTEVTDTIAQVEISAESAEPENITSVELQEVQVPEAEEQAVALPETTAAPTTAPPVATGTHYVANTNTGKFHVPSCSSVDQIHSENRWDFTGSREELIAQGYQPCKRCNP